MNIYEFTVIVDGLDIHDDAHTDRIYSSEFDLLLVERDGVTSVVASIEALDEDDALRMVISLLEWRGVTPLRVDEDFVNTTEISERLEVSRETVRLWTKDSKKNFPLNYTIMAGQKVWKWADIYAWAIAHDHDVSYFDTPLSAGLVTWFNARHLQDAYHNRDFHEIGSFAIEPDSDAELEDLEQVPFKVSA